MNVVNDKSKKFKTVIDRNTFYFYDAVFQEKYESHLNAIKDTLLVLKNQIENTSKG